jgi:hypothetical protein
MRSQTDSPSVVFRASVRFSGSAPFRQTAAFTPKEAQGANVGSQNSPRLAAGIIAALVIVCVGVVAIAIFLICRRRHPSGLQSETMSNCELYEEGYTVKFGSEELRSSGTGDVPNKSWFPLKNRLFNVAGDCEALSDLL